MKLCKDCRFSFGDGLSLRCGNPKVPPRDLATGDKEYADLVRQMRCNQQLCGIDAKLFEPKPAPEVVDLGTIPPPMPWPVWVSLGSIALVVSIVAYKLLGAP